MTRQRTHKASNGMGSLYPDRERGKWFFKWTMPDGKRMKVSADTMADAKKKGEAAMQAALTDPDLPTDQGTVKDFMTYWVEKVLPLADIKEGTRASYVNASKVHIVPAIGNVKLADMSPAHVRKLVNTMQSKGSMPNTVRIARTTLGKAMKAAYTDELIKRNPVPLTDGVKLGTSEPKALTIDQAKILLKYLDGHEMELPFTMMLFLGIRRGELAGLTWDHVKLPKEGSIGGTLRIARGLVKVGGKVELSTTKTTQTRTLHLPEHLVTLMKAHREAQKVQRDTWEANRGEFDQGWSWQFPKERFVFTNAAGNPVDMDKLNRKLQRITDDAGIGKFTPHALRHSAATIAHAENVSPKVIQEMLGHSSIRVTMDIYTGLFDDTHSDGVDAIAGVLLD